MKKSLYFAIYAVFAFFTPIFATTMCAINDSVAVILDPTINGTAGNTLDSTLGTWYATFPYGTIYGISACIDTRWGKAQGEYVDTLTDTNGNIIVGNERKGTFCWCKLTHPVTSRWTYLKSYASFADCFGWCANSCGKPNDQTLRVGLFGSVQQQ